MSQVPTPVAEVPITGDKRTFNSNYEVQFEHITVIRRNKKTTKFNINKIMIAITKALLATEGQEAAHSNRIHEMANQLTHKVALRIKVQYPCSGAIDIEEIQNAVETTLMESKLYEVLRSYILYREQRHQVREQAAPQHPQIHIVLPDGRKQLLSPSFLHQLTEGACQGLEGVSTTHIVSDAYRNLFDGASIQEVNVALIMATRTLVEKEPNYTFVAARLLLNRLRTEVLETLDLPSVDTQQDMQAAYPNCLKSAVAKGIAVDRLDARLVDFDLEQLGHALVAQRDFSFTYLGFQTLYDRYFLHYKMNRFELPQVFFMRVAMGLALNETPEQRNQRAIEFYHLLSKLDFMSSTPTLFNAGTKHSQLSSCFLSTIPDDLKTIYDSIRDNAMLSKFAGGIGNDWTPVRGLGSHIHGTNGKSLGVIPFINVANATAVAVNQGGKRKGAVCGYLEIWHIDIEDFAQLRKNTGDDRRRAHDMNIAVWIPDLFMIRYFNNQNWTLFSPDETPDLHDLYGKDFEKAYLAYEANADAMHTKQIPARNLWRHLLGMLFETGHPWITFKDPCNLRSPQQHTGVVHSSNLCTEITLNTSKDEVAVCNLGSINLVQHLNSDGTLNTDKLRKTAQTAIRMLDNVIDTNYYPIPQARHSNLKHRPIGLGIMGFQDALHQLKIPYASEEAITFADRSMEIISYYTIEASCQLARERGCYESYAGSLWSRGILPIDSIDTLIEARGKQYVQQDRSQTLPWDTLRAQIKQHGMRNSNVLAIAPTATIANICGVSQSIEPTYQNLFVKSNLSGEFTVVNTYLVRSLKKLDLWDDVMVNDLKYYNGSLQAIDRVPEELKILYATAFEIDSRWLIEAASRRQKWIDQSQSLNLYIAQASGKKLDEIYRTAWLKGLKTTYYCRSLGATDAEKSTIHAGKLNAVAVTQTTNQACNLDDPECEACQ